VTSASTFASTLTTIAGVASDGSTLVPTGTAGATVMTATWRSVVSAPIVVNVAESTDVLPITEITQTTAWSSSTFTVGRCRLTVSRPVLTASLVSERNSATERRFRVYQSPGFRPGLRAPMVSALETKIPHTAFSV